MRKLIGAAAAALLLAGCDRDASSPVDEAADSSRQEQAVSAPAEPGSSDKPLAIASAASDLSWGPCPPGMPAGCQLALLHGDPAKPNADIFLKVPGGAAIAPHWHSSAERMILVSGQLTVKYKGSPESILEPGTYAYGPARLPHEAECQSAQPCVLFIAFEGPVDRHSFDRDI